MKIHEFQAKELLKSYGIPVPEQLIVSSIEETKALLQENKWQSGVVKVQIHAGGRGKAGGVKVVHSAQDIISATAEMLGKKIVNEQTGPDGLISHQVMISPLTTILQEYYVAFTIDRELAEIVLIASPSGGTEIEETAQNEPGKMLVLSLPPNGQFRSYQLLRIAKWMHWNEREAKEGQAIIQALARAFIEQDASLIEINPLVKDDSGHLIALDAKIVIDDNALYRQSHLKKLFDKTQVPENEARAQENDLAYVSLDGDIGCMVNGAGLAMATMDIIHHFGGKPANFLDVGGSATKEKIAEGFKIILSDPKVKGILINIFGGIMSCATLAAGLKEAAEELKVSIPLVVRMEGTSVEEGKKILQDSKVEMVLANSLTDAAEKVVTLANTKGR